MAATSPTPTMVKINIGDVPRYDLITKVGSITLEYGVRGPELERELRVAQEKFIRAMELRGLTLFRSSGLANPKWTTNEDGSMTAWYAIDWEGKRKPRLHTDGTPLPRKRETSLEESEGEVEYRIVGVFWGPTTSMEILKEKQEIKDEEREAKHPTQFGYGSLPHT